MSAPGRVDAVLLRRSHVLRNLGIALAVAGFASSFSIQGEMRLPWFIGLVATGIFLAVLGEGSTRRVAVSLEADGVRVGAGAGERLLPRATIRSGWIERDFEGSRVHLDRGLLPDLELDAVDDAEARALLRALACDPSQTVVRFPSASRFAGWLAAVAGQLCGHVLLKHEHPFTATLCALSVVLYLVWFALLFTFERGETSVGSDGVLVSGLLRRTFVSFAEVESAVVESAGKLVVRTRAGSTLVRRMKAPAAEAAAEQIESALASVGDRLAGVGDQGDGPRRISSSAASGNALEQLRRQGDVGAWLTRLRALASRGPYRGQGSRAIPSGAWWTSRAQRGPSARLPLSFSERRQLRPSESACVMPRPASHRPACGPRSSGSRTRPTRMS